MRNLMFKEFGLAVHPLFLVAPLVFGALALIPQWIFLLIPLYFCFISAPNLLALYRSNKDNQFTALLPVPRRGVVTARVLTFVVLELLHVIGAGIFILIHHALHAAGNFSLDLNGSWFGITFAVYGIFNLVALPLYFQTADRIGAPVIAGTTAAVVIAGLVEYLTATQPSVRFFLEARPDVPALLPVMGVVVFAGLSVLSVRLSLRSFERVEL